MKARNEFYGSPPKSSIKIELAPLFPGLQPGPVCGTMSWVIISRHRSGGKWQLHARPFNIQYNRHNACLTPRARMVAMHTVVMLSRS